MNVEKEWKEKKMNDLRENRETKDLPKRQKLKLIWWNGVLCHLSLGFIILYGQMLIMK